MKQWVVRYANLPRPPRWSVQYGLTPEDARSRWSRRPGGYYDALFDVNSRTDPDGVSRSEPFAARLQRVGTEHFDLDPADPEHRMALAVRDATGEPPHEFTFENVRTGYGDRDDKYGVTGTGHGVEVVRSASDLLVGALHRFAPPVVYYTASEPSRASLYDALSSRVGRRAPDYDAHRVHLPGGPAVFALVHKDHAGAFGGAVSAAGLTTTPLTPRRRGPAPGPYTRYDDAAPKPPPPGYDHPVTAAVLGRMPAAAHARLAGTTSRVAHYPTSWHVTSEWYRLDEQDGNPPTPPHEHQVCHGFYDHGTGVVHVSAGQDDPEHDHEGATAHELGHAIDMSADRTHYQLSDHPEWRQAWASEIAPKPRLGEYARHDHIEGFAEFARLLYGSPHIPAAVAPRVFPRCHAYFRRLGLV